MVYVTDPAVTFVDGSESAQAYVVGLSSGAQPQAPAGGHRTLDMRAANGTRYRCYIPAVADGSEGGEGADGGSGSGGSVSPVSCARQGAAEWLWIVQ